MNGLSDYTVTFTDGSTLVITAKNIAEVHAKLYDMGVDASLIESVNAS